MAIDKAVDSAALEANLTTIANAIREKAGTSDALAFPAGFAEAIAGIKAGGGAKVSSGTFTTATKLSTNYSVEHGLGVVPDFVVVSIVRCAGSDIPTSYQLVICYQMSKELAAQLNLNDGSYGGGLRITKTASTTYNVLPGNYNETYPGITGNTSSLFIQNANETTFGIRFSGWSMEAAANTSYMWIAAALGE